LNMTEQSQAVFYYCSPSRINYFNCIFWKVTVVPKCCFLLRVHARYNEIQLKFIISKNYLAVAVIVPKTIRVLQKLHYLCETTTQSIN
ncbi:hypothetical protein T07_15070, partial [Trichinella nelsoni]